MGDVRIGLGDLLGEVFAAGGDYGDARVGAWVDRALAIVYRTLVEECAAGAVVGRLPAIAARFCGECTRWERDDEDPLLGRCSTCYPDGQTPGADDRGCSLSRREPPPPIPIAHVGSCASLAEPVAVELAKGRPCPAYRAEQAFCEDMELSTSAECGRGCHGVGRMKPPPFAAAIIEAGGVRTFVLASGPCQECGGQGWEYNGHGCDKGACPHCSGTGARTDVAEIARRYGGEGTPRSARFTVPS